MAQSLTQPTACVLMITRIPPVTDSEGRAVLNIIGITPRRELECCSRSDQKIYTIPIRELCFGNFNGFLKFEGKRTAFKYVVMDCFLVDTLPLEPLLQNE